MQEENNFSENIESILGGLESALSRGDTLQEAMESFYNAGYKKEDIEKAARALQEANANSLIQEQNSSLEPQKQKNFFTSILNPPKKNPEMPVNNQSKNAKEASSVQIVSKYGQPAKNPKRAIFIFLIAIIMLFLLGALAAIFLFKESLIVFFSNII